MKNKTLDYIFGLITGIALMIALYSCTNPLQASSDLGASPYNPLYVKIVD